MKQKKELSFNPIVPICFFLSSYMPLFLILSIKEIKKHFDYLHFGGFNREGFYNFFKFFLFPSIFIFLSVIALIGTYFTIKHLIKDSVNGKYVTIKTCKNNSSDFITYFSSYLFPLFFQNFQDWIDIFAVSMFIFFIFRVYLKSTIMMINPILSIFNYRVYEISFISEDKIERTGSVLTKTILEENELSKIYQFGNQVYFGAIK